ncbi:hypothetical protein IMZ38_03560 [Thermosphaera chiliense]|uniref:DUF4352 domain-containing protein n=1 Tax=Thermosphaera chiliense TaxID=3402707 RepID=A0A7M1USF7_9CREN|nr:hypothetical protein [Thermosphaera aggregans]QOR94986.1 hypothetical protein IMZ38_03560 [Thermosphaera aggregans]
MKTLHIVAVLILITLIASILYFHLKDFVQESGEVEILAKEAYISCGDLYIKAVFRSRSGSSILIDEVLVEGVRVSINGGIGFNGTAYVRVETENLEAQDMVALNIIIYNASSKQGESIPVYIKAGDALQYKLNVTVTRAFCYENFDINIYEVYYSGVFNIVLRIRNIGDNPATIDQAFIDGKTLSKANANSNLPLPLTLRPGEEKTVTIWLTTGYTHGQVIELRLHTMGGNEYSKLITLP